MEEARSDTMGEIDTAVDQLPFSDESFKVYREAHLAYSGEEESEKVIMHDAMLL